MILVLLCAGLKTGLGLFGRSNNPTQKALLKEQEVTSFFSSVLFSETVHRMAHALERISKIHKDPSKIV